VKIKLYLGATKPIRALLLSAYAGAKVPSVPTAETPEVGALLTIATAPRLTTPPIMDRGNLKDAEVLRELVRKSVVPALHHVTLTSLASA
jgi:hypothetical protein